MSGRIRIYGSFILAKGEQMDITVDGVSAGYGNRTVIRDISFSIATRQIAAIVGHNGAGKSTLLDAMYGLNDSSTGRVIYGGLNNDRRDPIRLLRAGIRYVPQENNVITSLKVREFLEISGFGLGINRGELADQVQALCARFSLLSEIIDRQIRVLSGGQRQLVAVIRALLGEPKVVLLDEPSLGLAPRLFKDILEPLVTLQRERGVTLLIVEQNINTLRQYADKYVVLRKGSVVDIVSKEDVGDEIRISQWY